MTIENKAYTHESVLLKELPYYLNPKDNSFMVDCTLGLGGHAFEMLSSTVNCTFLGIDADEEAIKIARDRLKIFDDKHDLYFSNAYYSDLATIIRRLNLPSPDIIYFDLGLSNMQLTDPDRGFSFGKDGPLDMRFSRNNPLTAEYIINQFAFPELVRIFSEYGEEPLSKKIALAIVKRRVSGPIKSTLELSEIIAKAKGGGRERIHPATKCFQALRIIVNNELERLEIALDDSVSLLKGHGRIGAISFHSLEDRIVKDKFRDEATTCKCPPEAPVCICDGKARLKIITKKPIEPSEEEVLKNPKARSAKLRIAEKLFTGERGSFLLIIGIILFIASLLLGYVYLKVAPKGLSLEASRLNSIRAKLMEENNKLRLELASLKTPERLNELALKLNMKKPKTQDEIYIHKGEEN